MNESEFQAHVTTLLERQAMRAPEPDGLLPAVHRGRRVRRARYAGLAVAGLALAVVAGIVAVPGTEKTGQEDPPVPTVPPYSLAQFPYTPTWTPEALEDERPFALYVGDTLRLTYTGFGLPDGDAAEDWDDRVTITVEVTDEPPTIIEEGTWTADVGPRRDGVGYAYQEDTGVHGEDTLTWDEDEKSWVTVRARGLSMEDMVEYANGLVHTPLDRRVNSWFPGCNVKLAEKYREQVSTMMGEVWLMSVQHSESPLPDGLFENAVPVSVMGHPGYLGDLGGLRTLGLEVPGGGLMIRGAGTEERLWLTDDDLIAAAVEPLVESWPCGEVPAENPAGD